jgi:ATP/maltotriose-dependent transcriptional regulator MalT
VSHITDPGSHPLLVGRDRELSILRQHLAAAVGGHGSLVLISGEAGIGKTALANALCREAAEQGALVLVGRCYDLTETPPYGPWVELFATYAPEHDRPALPTAFAQRGTISDVISQAALFHDVRDFLTALATHGPLVLLLDDLHWADPASLDLLRFLARSLSNLPIVILVTYRSDELTRRHPFFALIPTLEREAGANLLDLRRLSPDALRALVATRYALGDEEAARLAAYLDDRAEGNPFFAVHLLRALEDADILSQGETGWTLADLSGARLPSMLRQVLETRVLRLGAEAERLLRVAAVIGQAVPFSLWAVVADATEETLLAVLEAAIEAHLVETTDEGFRFTHALVREALHEGILPPRRRVLHRRIAEALLAMPRPEVEAIAHHLREAGDARAVEWLIAAGDRAIPLFAWRSALASFEAAQHLAEVHGLDAATDPYLIFRLARVNRYVDLRAGAGYLDRAEEWLMWKHRALGSYAIFYRGWLLNNAREFRRGIADMEQGVALLDTLTDDERHGLRDFLARISSAWQIHPVSHLAGRYIDQGRYREAQACAERAQRLAAGGSETVPIGVSPMGQAAMALTDVYAAWGQLEAARQASARARERCRSDGIPLNEAYAAINELMWVAIPYRTERVDERHHLAALAEAALWRAQDRSPDLSPRFGWLPVLALEGPWDEACAVAVAARKPSTGVLPYKVGTRLLGHIALRQGDTDLLWSLVREVLPEGAKTEPGDAAYPNVIAMQRLAAAASVVAGDLAGAAEWLRAHTAWLDLSETVLGRAEVALLWAQHDRVAGDMDEALRHAREALALASTPRQPLALIAAHRLLGELETDRQRPDHARTHLLAALALAERCAVPYERALTLLALAELDAQAGNRTAARTQVDIAHNLLEALGARPMLARADGLRARLAPDHAHASHPDGLTAREVMVLRLIATGRSNREIAATLSISERTVNRHITNLYTKIAARGRADATAWAIRHALA